MVQYIAMQEATVSCFKPFWHLSCEATSPLRSCGKHSLLTHLCVLFSFVTIMDSLYTSGIWFAEMLQMGLPGSEDFWLWVTFLGDPKCIFIIYFPLAYFLLDQKVGVKVLWLGLISEWLNLVSKWFLFGERPFWWMFESGFSQKGEVFPRQFPASCETGPGSPSGHCMITGAALWPIMNMLTKRISQHSKRYIFMRRQFRFPVLPHLCFLIHFCSHYLDRHFPLPGTSRAFGLQLLALPAIGHGGQGLKGAEVQKLWKTPVGESEFIALDSPPFPHDIQGALQVLPHPFTTTLCIARMVPLAAYLLLLLAVGLSRIFILAHFPHQVIGGTVAAIILGWLLESWVPQDRGLQFYLWASMSLLLSTLMTYWTLVALGVDLAWSINLATKWCLNPKWIRMDTRPFASLCRDAATALGLGLALHFRRAQVKQERLGWPCRAWCAALALVVLRLLSDMGQPQEAALWYGLAFVKYATFPWMVVTLLPKIVLAVASRATPPHKE
ncbi:Glucose-6-phosphatase 3 [Varanus komodoensis]|nr:Glucose-6-phosphatase 3 [Varanus komodoensis]